MTTTQPLGPGSMDRMIRADLMGRSCAYINMTDGGATLDDEIYAINWFDTNIRWVYDLYNLLASFSVRAIGGMPFFKGHMTRVVHGSKSDTRSTLLIVKYPSLHNFKKMLESKVFQTVSVLRMLAVRQFTFGFTRPFSKGTEAPAHGLEGFYAVHHYKGGSNIAQRIEQVTHDFDINVFYSGKISALLYSGNADSISEQIPCLMEEIVLLRGNTERHVEELLQSDGYQAIVGDTQSSFIGLFRRVL